MTGESCNPASGYAYCRQLSIDYTQAGGSTLSNFPVLVNAVLGVSRLQNANCYDIIFTTDSQGTSRIPWEQETCQPSTGAIVDWVILPSISASVNTVFYISYGNTSLAAAQNTGSNAPANVWQSSYAGVWHLPNGSTLTANDSTANAFNGKATNVAAATGEIDGAGSFNGSNSYVDLSGSVLSATSQFAVSFWARTSAAGSSQRAVTKGYYGGDDGNTGFLFQMQPSGVMAFGLGYAHGTAGITSSAAVNDGNWHHFVGVLNSGTLYLYIDGSPAASPVSTSLTLASTSHMQISGYNNASGEVWNGSVDELEVLTSALQTNWITAEYNNQKSASTFVIVGAEI
jgi:hypothetical protein